MAQIRSKPFGVTKQGANVTEYILSNPGVQHLVGVVRFGLVGGGPGKQIGRAHV